MCDRETEQWFPVHDLAYKEPRHSPLGLWLYKTKSPLSCHREQSVAALVPMLHDEQPFVSSFVNKTLSL